MNKKGQALVEFILILPVLLIIFISMIDVGNIFVKKYELSKDLSYVSTLYQNGEKEKALAYCAKENIVFSEEKEDKVVTITLKKDIDINAPFLTSVLGKKHQIEEKTRVFENE